MCAGAELMDSMHIISAVLTQPPASAAFPELWVIVWPIMVKALEEGSLQYINQPAMRTLAVVVARFVGEAITRHLPRRMLPEEDSFVLQLAQLLFSSLRKYCRHPFIGILVLVLSRFACLCGGYALVHTNEQDERHAFLIGIHSFSELTSLLTHDGM